MEGSLDAVSEGCDAGGIISLAKFIAEHREAVGYDLVTMTGYQLADIGTTLGWDSVKAFLVNLGMGSALMHELHPEENAWGTRTKTNGILADIYDILAQINANLIAIGTGRPAKRPKPYPRPKQKDKEEERHFGRGGLPPDELRKWFEKKREEHAGSGKCNINSDSGPVGSTEEPDGAADR